MNALQDLEQYARPVQEMPVTHTFQKQYPREHLWILTSSFDFALKMRSVLLQWGGLTPGQLAAVQKCMGYEAAKAAREAPAPRPVAQKPASGLDLSKVPSGYYSVPNGATRLKVKIQQIKSAGRWAGYTFVSDGAVYGQARRYGLQAPGQSYSGEIRDQLAIIALNPRAASAAYGRLTGTCGVCGRHLEDETSVANGIGPVCASRMGW